MESHKQQTYTQNQSSLFFAAPESDRTSAAIPLKRSKIQLPLIENNQKNTQQEIKKVKEIATKVSSTLTSVSSIEKKESTILNLSEALVKLKNLTGIQSFNERIEKKLLAELNGLTEKYKEIYALSEKKENANNMPIYVNYAKVIAGMCNLSGRMTDHISQLKNTHQEYSLCIKSVVCILHMSDELKKQIDVFGASLKKMHEDIEKLELSLQKFNEQIVCYIRDSYIPLFEPKKKVINDEYKKNLLGYLARYHNVWRKIDIMKQLSAAEFIDQANHAVANAGQENECDEYEPELIALETASPEKINPLKI